MWSMIQVTLASQGSQMVRHRRGTAKAEFERHLPLAGWRAIRLLMSDNKAQYLLLALRQITFHTVFLNSMKSDLKVNIN
jgi:hypothetical protein